MRRRKYMKQPLNSFICFPTAVHNFFVFIKRNPPSMKTLIKKCRTDKTGTFPDYVDFGYLKKKGLQKTSSNWKVLRKGGLLMLKTNKLDIEKKGVEAHAVFCEPSNFFSLKVNVINTGNKYNVVEKVFKSEIRKHFLKNVKNWYII